MSTLILRCSCLLLINLNSSWQYLHIPVLTYLFILLVNNFVVNEGNSATEALSSSPSAFAKHTHKTIWLNTISSYFEMPFPSQSSLQYKQINIYISYVNDGILIPEALSETPESSPLPFTLGKLAKITRSKMYLFWEAIGQAQICFLLDVLHFQGHPTGNFEKKT